MQAKPNPAVSSRKALGRKALGRGLDALLPTKPQIDSSPGSDTSGSSAEVRELRIDRIDPNPYQPRRNFDQKALLELSRSIRVDGLVQPILVRPDGSRFALIVGERRWRAAKIAGLATISAIVREIEPERVLEVTLVENIQREDLNPIEVARAFDRMIQELHLSHEEVATRTGKDRSTITNLLRLLRLPRDVQQLIAERRISGGHARAILGLEDATQQVALAEKAAAQGLSVRQVERTVRSLTESRKSSGKTQQLDPNVAAAVAELEQRLGTKVRLIQQGRSKGKIELEYYSEEDLERIYSTIMGTG